MKLKFISMAVFSALTLGVATSASAAPATVNGGTVHFKGEVVNAACAVNMCCKYELSRSDSFARSSSYEKVS